MEKTFLDGKAEILVARVPEKHASSFPQLLGNSVIVSDYAAKELIPAVATVVRLSENYNRQQGDKLNSFSLESEKFKHVLDERGMVRLGALVRKGSVLVAATTNVTAKDLSEEIKLLRAIFGGVDLVKDDVSLLYPFMDAGIVSSVRLLDRHNWQDHSFLPVNVDLRAEVEVVVRKELKVGDILLLDQKTKAVVAGILPYTEMNYQFLGEPVDMLVGPLLPIELKLEGTLRRSPKRRWANWFKTSGSRLLVAIETQRCEQKVEHRSTGKYYILNEQPFKDGPNPGQTITPKTISSLLEAGFPENVREFVSSKCDSVEGRRQAYESLVKGETVLPANPWSTQRLKQILLGLNFELLIEGDKLFVKSLNNKGYMDPSFGLVENCQTINHRTCVPVFGGLFCERIFGTERDWKCRCGKYDGMQFSGKVCDCCTVVVRHSRVRKQRFGHINLAKPVFHPWLLQQSAERAGLDLATLTDLMDFSKPEDYERVEKIKADLLADDQGLVIKTILVLPPDLRPMVMLGNGNFATADVNHLYQRVINRSSRLEKLNELNAPWFIIANEVRLLQLGVDALIDNNVCSRPVLGSDDSLLLSLNEMLKEPISCIDQKRTDYSAKAVVIADPDIPNGSIGIPLVVVASLFYPMIVRKLKLSGRADTIISAKKLIDSGLESIRSEVELVASGQRVLVASEADKVAALQVIIKEGEVFRFSVEDAKILEISFNGDKLRVFAPLSQLAKDELANPKPLTDTSRSLTFESLKKAILSRQAIDLTPADKILLGID